MKILLLDKLEAVAEENIGQPMLFMWVEAVREFLEDRTLSQEEEVERFKTKVQEASVVEEIVERVKCPEIITGDCIEDRKSVFQESTCISNLGEMVCVYV